MKVPSAHMAVVEREKITAYLLNPAHPDNGGKAAFFRLLGFSRKSGQRYPRLFASSLRQRRSPRAWNRRAVGSIFWMAVSSPRAARRHW